MFASKQLLENDRGLAPKAIGPYILISLARDGIAWGVTIQQRLRFCINYWKTIGVLLRQQSCRNTFVMIYSMESMTDPCKNPDC